MDSKATRIAHTMATEGLPQAACDAFLRHYDLLLRGEDGFIREDTLDDVGALTDAQTLVAPSTDDATAVFAQVVMIKLNGGLGTSMGLSRAKSLLAVKDGLCFLDLIAQQAIAHRCPLVLMNSFATQADSLAAVARYPALQTPGLPLDFLQHKVPKLDVTTLSPIEWPDANKSWCPPGHGDIYTALNASGLLDRLLEERRYYAFISNADNLGATVAPEILHYMATNKVPFLLEAAERTASDRKGGHLGRRGDRLTLRESAQCAPQDRDAFQDIHRHRYFNTNNLWIDLRVLKRVLDNHGGYLPLPLIRNRKPVDPTNPSSPQVYQLESAMGAAIEVFAGAQAIRVPRSRFVPVKTTSDLLRIRSDATRVSHDGVVTPAQTTPCDIQLDPSYFAQLDDFEARFASGPPSLRDCQSLQVQGDVHFGKDIVCRGHVEIAAGDDNLRIADGTIYQ